MTTVFTFAVPAGYESLTVYDDTPEDKPGIWEAQSKATVLSYIEYLPDAVANRVRKLTSHYRLVRERANGETFWINHCEHCGAQLEEEDLHEFDGPFGPMPSEGPEVVQVERIRKPFEAWAGRESHDLKILDG